MWMAKNRPTFFFFVFGAAEMAASLDARRNTCGVDLVALISVVKLHIDT